MAPPYQVPYHLEGTGSWKDSMEWILDSKAALRHVLRFLPYPEVAVQSEPLYWLLTWGEREVYRHQALTLRRIAEDEENND